MYLSMAFHACESFHWFPDHMSTALPYLSLPFLLVYLCGPDSLSLSAHILVLKQRRLFQIFSHPRPSRQIRPSTGKLQTLIISCSLCLSQQHLSRPPPYPPPSSSPSWQYHFGPALHWRPAVTAPCCWEHKLSSAWWREVGRQSSKVFQLTDHWVWQCRKQSSHLQGSKRWFILELNVSGHVWGTQN